MDEAEEFRERADGADEATGNDPAEGEPAETEEVMVDLAPPERFLAEAERLGVAFEGQDLERLETYLALLRLANELMNLTSIVEPEAMWERHILDALTLLPLIAEAQEARTGDGALRVADVGSGGGAPGLPLAIVCPDVRFTLIESTGKKAMFLEDASAQLACGNVEVVSARAETLGQDPAHRGAYDLVTARAVGRIAVVAELCVPLARVGGRVLLIKGRRAEEELEEARQALHRLHAQCVGVMDTPTGRIVVLEKQRETPASYPRRPGEPKKSPIMR